MRFCISTIVVGASLLAAPVAIAQDSAAAQPAAPDSDLRRLQDELAAQRKETDSLRKELTETRQQLSELRSLLADVKGLLERLLKKPDPAARSTTPGLSEPSPLVTLPADPFACPDCLLQELRKRYASRFGSSVPAEGASRRERLIDIAMWCRDVNHDLRGKARWIIRIESLKEEGGKLAATYSILDPNSRATLGSPRTDSVPAHFHTRLKAAGHGSIYEIGLWVGANVAFNENRPDEGIFNVPLLLAPFVEWDMKAEWTSLESIEGDRKKKIDNTPR